MRSSIGSLPFDNSTEENKLGVASSPMKEAGENRKTKVKAALESASFPDENPTDSLGSKAVEKVPAGEKLGYFDPSGWKTLESASPRKKKTTRSKVVDSASPKKKITFKKPSTETKILESTSTEAKASDGHMPLAGGETPPADEIASLQRKTLTKTRPRSSGGKVEKTKSLDINSKEAAAAANTRSKSTDAKKTSRFESKDSKAIKTRPSRKKQGKQAAATKLQSFIRGAMARQRVSNLVGGMIEELQNSVKW
jgi:hypothetical protein